MNYATGPNINLIPFFHNAHTKIIYLKHFLGDDASICPWRRNPKKFHFENIFENLCLRVIILGFLNVSPYNFFADIFWNVATFTAPLWA